MQVLPKKGYLEARFQLGLPASGRSIEGQWAADIFSRTVPHLVESSLMWHSLDQVSLFPGIQPFYRILTIVIFKRIKYKAAVTRHVLCCEDQEFLRSQLAGKGLSAFVADGSILPRAHGASDKPMSATESVPFKSPDTLRVTFTLPNSGSVSGMGVRKGITLLVGGGFHGKSTLLQALELGVYNHIPGDGREFVSCDPTAVKIRAEDGRPIHSLNISVFINNLPFGRSTQAFSTGDASGSTSQAANIMEVRVEAAALPHRPITSLTYFQLFVSLPGFPAGRGGGYLLSPSGRGHLRD